LKALTPDNIEVRIADENFEAINYDEHWDLVGITVMVHLLPSAIEVAGKFRERGTKVAFGGFFPTLWHDDVRDYVDTVVAGEAEYIWQDVIRDLQEKQLKPYYRARQLIDLKDVPFIKREFFSEDSDTYQCESTRGCPYNCDYCSVTTFFGKKFRHRPIDHVVRQLEELQGKAIVFADDNIMADPKYSRELLKAIIPLKIIWGAQSSINRAEDRELMELAAESGCLFLFTGFESLSLENLQSVNKGWANPKRFKEWIKATHDVGIAIYGSFMFGFEGDGPDVFRRTLDFCEENEIELALFSALVPLIGSKFYQQLKAENRFFETDYAKFDGQYATFHPKKMTSEQLEDGLRWIWQNFYSKKNIKNRLASVLEKEKPKTDNKGRPNSTLALLALNTAFEVAVEDF
jgi:radical SAM superfamily enzyme YgiQ (UPF0313 family)